MRLFLLLFIGVPLLEIYVLIAVGKRIGGLETVALIVATALLGIALLKQQGYKAMANAQLKMQQGTLPATEMVDGIFLAVGGALLLTPGFVTDAIGFACLIPGLRHGLIFWLVKRLQPTMMAGFHSYSSSSANNAGRTHNHHAQNAHIDRSRGENGAGHNTIEGQFHREDD